MVRVLRSPLEAIGCTLLPGFCTLCGSPLPQFSSAPICDACWAEVRALDGPACTCCGDALDAHSHPADQARCRACRLAPPGFVRAISFGLYEGRMRGAIHALKYGGVQTAAAALGNKLATAAATLANEAPREMLVIPVPLHRTRYRMRGFNQTRLLAEHALAELHNSHPQWKLTLAPRALLRVRATVTQAGLTPRQRRINLRKAFAVENKGAVTGRDVLLIDDILTTGATVRAASRALLDAGAKTIWVATLARARRSNIANLPEFESTEAEPRTTASVESWPQRQTAVEGITNHLFRRGD